jgi:hypothetical protein
MCPAAVMLKTIAPGRLHQKMPLRHLPPPIYIPSPITTLHQMHPLREPTRRLASLQHVPRPCPQRLSLFHACEKQYSTPRIHVGGTSPNSKAHVLLPPISSRQPRGIHAIAIFLPNSFRLLLLSRYLCPTARWKSASRLGINVSVTGNQDLLKVLCNPKELQTNYHRQQ